MTWQLVSEMLTAAAPAIANHLWQSTVWLIAAAILTLALRKNQARVRYAIWLAASIKFLIPFALLIGLGGHLAKPSASVQIQPDLYFAMQAVNLPFTQPTASLISPVAQPTAHRSLIRLLPIFLAVVWLCGFAATFSLWWLRWRRISAAMRSALPMSQGREVDALRQLERSAGVRRPIAFLLSRDSLEPGIFGIVRPVLLWPAGISKHLDDAHLKAILAHEMCHVRRRDNLAAAMHMVVEAVFWFHPLVWWVGTRLVEERERACDEEVLRLGNEAQMYAEGILKTCEFCVGSPLTCVSGVTGADLKQRIVRIMSEHVARKLNFSRKLLLTAAGLMAITVPIVFGLVHAAQSWAQSSTDKAVQSIAGTWQGTVSDGGHDLRTEIKIANVASGGYTTTLYSIDRGGAPTGATMTAFGDGTLTFSIEALNVKYEGKISADGKTITGNWTEGPNTQPLVLTRTIPETAWPIPEPPKPMAPDANPGFDVVTIKPSKPGTPGQRINFRGTQFIAVSVNMNDLIALAYGMHTKQILGAPDWFGTDLFDIDGKPDVDGFPSLHQMGEMTQKLLADRFALKFHHEQREIAAYIITVAGSGPKMDKTTLGPNDHRQGFASRGPGDLVVRNLDMAEFAMGMQSTVMDKPVVDHTGLTGKYDFTLKWTPDDSQFAQSRDVDAVTPPGAGDNPNAPPSLYTAVQEQLGLKIEAGKTMVDVIVIDHVEKPSPN